MRLAVDAVESLSFSDPTARIASCLLRLNNSSGTWEGKIPITQTELATIAKISRRRVVDALKILEADSSIVSGYGFLEIRIPETLSARLSGVQE
jgi:CRP-like cAMP-binding protein